MQKEKLYREIKSNPVVRLLVKPFRKIEQDYAHIKYIKSGENKRIQRFKDMFVGETCYIIGNGPSLRINDLERIGSNYSFGSNGIHQLFSKTDWRPTFYTCYDVEDISENRKRLSKIDAKYIIIDFKAKRIIKDDIDNIYYFYSKFHFPINKYDPIYPFISENVSDCVSDGQTITFINIQLAFYMGFKTIYLLGIDHNYSRIIHRDGTVENNIEVQNYSDDLVDDGLGVQFVDNTTEAYEEARKYAENKGIKILNATRGGKLEVFPRVEFDRLTHNYNTSSARSLEIKSRLSPKMSNEYGNY